MTFDLAPFRSWLLNRSYSEATIRNYLVDIGRYFDYVKQLPASISYDVTSNKTFHILSPSILQDYVRNISTNSNAGRYLASLNLFCQFALDQHLISQNPIKKIKAIKRSPQMSGLLERWEKYLESHNTAPTTIRNYINDLNQYINWLKIFQDGV